MGVIMSNDPGAFTQEQIETSLAIMSANAFLLKGRPDTGLMAILKEINEIIRTAVFGPDRFPVLSYQMVWSFLP